MVILQNRLSLNNGNSTTYFARKEKKLHDDSVLNYRQTLDKDEFKGKKVDFKEGSKIFLKGFGDKIRDFATMVFKHPIKSLSTIALTGLGLLALPFAGISIATGAAALAIVFGTFAIAKTVKHTYNAFKHSKNNDYDSLRKDLSKLGGDGFDLLLSVPFMPKGVKSLYGGIKYGGSTLGYNAELVNAIKKPNLTIMQRFREIGKANLRIMYEQMKRECNLNVAPTLEFADLQSASGRVNVGHFDQFEGNITIEEKFTNPLFMNITDNFLRHELEHFIQVKEIVANKQFGLEFYKKILSEQLFNDLKKNPPQEIFSRHSTITQKEQIIKQAVEEIMSEFNESFFKEVAQKNVSTLPIEKIEEYIQGMRSYTIPNETVESVIKYYNNPLERDAFKAGDEYTGTKNLKLITPTFALRIPIFATRPDINTGMLHNQLFLDSLISDKKENTHKTKH